MQVEVVLEAGAMIGESPVWDADQRLLTWIDIKAPAFYRFDPASGAQRSWSLPSDVGAYCLTADRDTVIVALRDGIYRLRLGSGALEQAAAAPFDPALHRFNEGACDSRGRFWIGTMFDPLAPGEHAPEVGGLFC